jgi:hypothetical protein
VYIYHQSGNWKPAGGSCETRQHHRRDTYVYGHGSRRHGKLYINWKHADSNWSVLYYMGSLPSDRGRYTSYYWYMGWWHYRCVPIHREWKLHGHFRFHISNGRSVSAVCECHKYYLHVWDQQYNGKSK